ncbi:MAG: leucyl/phenylalanyl-tRNA--protein transferase [endosymbiont of Galathealinum brachiosum]|uniref:Leucyl/phenylalanyl-tRNA--protein transferase n=1 Tax=endosymbiont of Galathealinum brachiosum TaxID=2200906 RepID=A0A370DK56_9GAMM|nr:MAG: leucyl/phenylalanyl-tRNA--protein transferase [endosymbiont of Galathealinum brachiosum]
MISLQWLDPKSSANFPDVETTLDEPQGLLAAGGDLSIERLTRAYKNGIFPWYSPGEPLLWWSPDPRFVLFPEEIKISRSLAKNVRNHKFEIRMDTEFEQVISLCGNQPRKDQPGTWITDEMRQAYIDMHHAGHAHCVECWSGDELVGGLYGIHTGQIFCGESMFSRESNASKIALVHLCQFLINNGFKLIDSQVYTEHLERLGAKMIARKEYIEILQQEHNIDMPDNWSDLFNNYMNSKY